MKTFFSEKHRLHFPQGEFFAGELVTPFERPSRVEYVLNRLNERGFERPVDPGDVDFGPLSRVHDEGFLEFLKTAWADWKAEGFGGEVFATSFPLQRTPKRPPPRNIDGKVGYYATSGETAITAGTWEAALSSCATAQAAQRHVAAGARSAFALCRPPGHHAAGDLFGGFCFLNNAAVVAEMFRMNGAEKVAILDIDFHHGNGTQDIFYRRGDIFFVSLHGQPEDAYPYFLGYADEKGEGAGEGANVNYPLAPGTTYARWAEALDDAIARIHKAGAEAVVVSLGLDTFKDDPISFFKLESEDYLDCGRRIAKMGLPTVFVMEGGYSVEALGINTVNVLEGFENG
ncbi:MAG: acetylpolyamine amidohydrolase [Hyphomicrobiales bacterium]|nr:MAG: acetylpolyamine amidohydrolase [Hyphomicrobiales bacterium]